MAVCPVCEAPVVAPVCEVCGHCFRPPSSPEANVTQLQDLELPQAPGLAAPVVPLSDVEPTRFPATPEPDTRSEVDWERTSWGQAPDVAAGGMAELDTGREASAGEPVLRSAGPVTCRYCRNVQATGLLCERCGMRLPRSVPSSRVEEVLVRCQQCGERSYPRERCASCGAPLSRET
jgi:hypothetical protein